jgi:hypothetical protein
VRRALRTGFEGLRARLTVSAGAGDRMITGASARAAAGDPRLQGATLMPGRPV